MFEFFKRVWHKILRNLSNQEQLRELISEEFDNFKNERLDSKYELIDPELIPLEFVDLYASDYGETLDRQFSTSGSYLRRQLQNIVSKIKSKSLPDMVYYLLYTFGFSGELFNLWTSNYDTFVRFPLGDSDGKLYSNTGLFANTSYLSSGRGSQGGLYANGVYPTSHFAIVFYLNQLQSSGQFTYLWERVYLEYFKKLLDERRAVRQVPHYVLQLVCDPTTDGLVKEVFNVEGNLIAEVNTTANWVGTDTTNYIYWRGGTGNNPSRDDLQTSSFSDVNAQERFKIAFIDDVNSSLQNKYFQFKDNDGEWLYVWYNVSGNGIDPKAIGTPVEISINVDDTADIIRQKTYDVMSTIPEFLFPVNTGNQLDIQLADYGDSERAFDGTTGFTIDSVIVGSSIDYGIGGYVQETNNVNIVWEWSNTTNPKDEDITEFSLYNSNKDCVLYVTCLPIQRSLLSSIEIKIVIDNDSAEFDMFDSDEISIIDSDDGIILGVE